MQNRLRVPRQNVYLFLHESLAQSQEAVTGDLEIYVKIPNHSQAERPFSGEHFGCSVFSSKVFCDIGLFKAQLIHPEFNGLNGIGRRNWTMFLLIGFNYCDLVPRDFGIRAFTGIGS